jgi:hypothetical protein
MGQSLRLQGHFYFFSPGALHVDTMRTSALQTNPHDSTGGYGVVRADLNEYPGPAGFGQGFTEAGVFQVAKSTPESNPVSLAAVVLFEIENLLGIDSNPVIRFDLQHPWLETHSSSEFQASDRLFERCKEDFSSRVAI